MTRGLACFLTMVFATWIFATVEAQNIGQNRDYDSMAVYMYVNHYPVTEHQSVFSPAITRIRCTMVNGVINAEICETYNRQQILDKEGQLLFNTPHKTHQYRFELHGDDGLWSNKDYTDLLEASKYMIDNRDKKKDEVYSDHDTVVGITRYAYGKEVYTMEIGEFDLYANTAFSSKINTIITLLSRIKHIGSAKSVQDMKEIDK